MFNKILIFLLILNNLKLIMSRGRLENNSTVIFESCSIHDLRNISGYHNDPLAVIVRLCSLYEIPNALFIRFTNIESLEIIDSRLTNLQDYALNGLKNLQHLTLSKNNLTIIKSWSDHDLSALYTLDLRRNNIKEIYSDGLDKYPNLTKLNLAVNLLESLPDGVFKSNPNLKNLNLGKNLLQSIQDDTFKGLHKLVHLSLHNNKIRTIDFFGFNSLIHLKTLHLEGNELAALEPELMTNLPMLQYFNMSGNFVENIINSTFKKNIELKILDISWNRLHDFNDNTLRGIESLEVFNVSRNKIQNINKYMFREFANLRILDISHNNITIVADNVFQFAPNLEYINFSRNAINLIEHNIFLNLYSLYKLDLSYNQLDSDNFLDKSSNSLLYLNLTGNLYRQLDSSKFYGLDEVQLYNNPWDCKWLIGELIQAHRQLKFGNTFVIDRKNITRDLEGIDCYDANNTLRNIIIMESEHKEKESYVTSTLEVNEKPNVTQFNQRNPTENEFDWKTSVIWLGIGIFLVFGITKACRILLKKSEKKTENWRRSQHPPPARLKPKRVKYYPTTNYYQHNYQDHHNVSIFTSSLLVINPMDMDMI